jgi:hypothetical protein
VKRSVPAVASSRWRWRIDVRGVRADPRWRAAFFEDLPDAPAASGEDLRLVVYGPAGLTDEALREIATGITVVAS